MASVHGTIASLGGDVSIDSTPGVGTAVSILLPVAPADGGQVSAASTGDLGVDGSHHEVDRTVHAVVVDDESGVLELVRLRLERRGVTVTPFEMPGEAVDYIADPTHRVDVVVTDLTMPSMTGVDLIRAVRTDRPELPIIVMSGYGPGLHDDDRADLGISVVIDKPFTGEALWNAFTSAIASTPASSGGT